MRRILLLTGVPVLWALCVVLSAQPAADITPLGSHPASAELTQKIDPLIKGENIVAKPAVVFASIVAGAKDLDGAAVLPAMFSPGEGQNLANGRLLCLLIDPTHVGAESIITVRLVRPEGAGLPGIKVAFNTLQGEGQQALQTTAAPNTDWVSAVMSVPLDKLPPAIADKLATAGPLKIGAVTSPKGFHILLAAAEGGRSAIAFTVPTVADLQAHGATWSENAAAQQAADQ
jgi:hypothetical protein